MPTPSDNLAASVTITNQAGAIEALSAQQARPQPMDADLQAQAENEVALEFAKAGKLAPNDEDFSAATEQRLEQFREQARQKLEQEAQTRGMTLPTLPTVPPVLTPVQARKMGPDAAAEYNAARPAAIGNYYQAIADLRGGGSAAATGPNYSSSSFSAPAGAGAAFNGLSFNSPDVEAGAVARAWRGPLAGGKDGDGGGGNGNGLPPGIAGGGSDAAGGGPPRDPDDYDAIMQRRRDVEADQRNLYSAGGRFGELDTESARRERLGAYQAGSIATSKELQSLAPEPVVSGYHERVARKQEIEASLRETYTQDGKFDKIGGREFNAERDAFHRDEHLIEPKRRGLSGAMENLREDKMGLAFGIGFSALSVGTGVASLAELDNGQYVSPEARQRAEVNAVAPGAAGILGSVIGAASGIPGGSLVGQFAGGAIGQAGSAVFGAASEREETTRQTAETLTAALGESAGKLREFSDAITATGAPVKQLQSALASVGQSGTFGAGTVAGVGALTNAFGEHADANFAAIGKYDTNPMLHGIARRFSQGQAGSADIDALAYDAAENGDFGTLKQLQQAAGDARVKDDPQFQAAAKHIDDVSNSQFGLGAAPVAFARFARAHGLDLHNDISNALNTEDERRTTLGADPNVAEQNRVANEFADAKSRALGADADISRAQAEGRSAADIAGVRDVARGVLAGNISRYQADEANPLNAGRKDELNAKISQAEAASATLSHSDFEDSLKERTAGFSLAQTRARIEGRSASDISREMRGQADFLEGVQGPIGPAERSGLQEQAAQLRYTAKTSVYDENLSQIDLRTTQAQGRVSAAQVSGGPEQAYEAQQGVLRTYTDRIKELSQELSAGGLTVSDRIGKEKELSQTRAASVTLAFQAQQEEFSAKRGIAQDTLGADTDGLSRQIAIRGNAAVTPDILREAQGAASIDAAQLAADEKRYPGNKGLLARERRLLAGDTLTRDELTTQSETYSPDNANQIEDANLRGQQYRANRQGGQAAMDASRASLQNDRSDLATLNAVDSTATDSVARATNARNRQGLLSAIADDTTHSQTLSLSPEERMQDAAIRQARELSLDAPYTEEGGNPFARNAAQIAQDKKRAAEFTDAANKSTDPLAKEDNQNKAFGYQREAAGLEREQRDLSGRLLPELIAGGGGGTGSAVVPFAAMSAALGGGTPFAGSWGTHGSVANTEGAGNVANRFGIWAGNGADFAKSHPQAGHDTGTHTAPFSSSTGSDTGAQTVALLSRIVQALEKHPNPTSSTPQFHAGGIAAMLNTALNAHGIH